MDFYALIKANRSYRRFHEDHLVEKETMQSLIEYARLSPSARNMQSLRFLISYEKEKNDLIFQTLAWAGYIKDWVGPIEGERPSAYVVILNDTSVSSNYLCDDGIMAQSILLGAVDKGLGGCIIASVNKKKLQENLQIPEKFEIVLVLAIGKPKEEVVIEDISDSGDVKYWRDENNVHHVPKRSINDLIIK